MLNRNENLFLKKIIDKYSKNIKPSRFIHPLHNNAFSTDDILRGTEVLLNQKITMSSITEEFEYKFAKFIGSKYALMVNSGSSANLLASFALINPKKRNRLKRRLIERRQKKMNSGIQKELQKPVVKIEQFKSVNGP